MLEGQLQQLKDQQAKLLEAFYGGAVPLTREQHQAELAVAASSRASSDLEITLEAALAVAGSCDRRYRSAPPAQRRQINQGFFKKLFLDQDGDIERFEMTEPFATLLDRSLPEQLAARRAASRELGNEAQDTERAQPSSVLINSFVCAETQQPDGGAARLG